MAQYGVLKGCELFFEFKNAIHDQLGCPEASKGQTRGQKQTKTTSSIISGKSFNTSQKCPQRRFLGTKIHNLVCPWLLPCTGVNNEPAGDHLGLFIRKSRGGSNGKNSAIKIEEKKRKTDILLV